MSSLGSSMTSKLQAVRSVPRSARVSQGYTRIADFAAMAWSRRNLRAQALKLGPSPEQIIRQDILARLQRILGASLDLRRAARKSAGLRSYDNPPCEVVWRPRDKATGIERTVPVVLGYGYGFRWLGKYKFYSGSYIASTRHVSVPACWLLGRIREQADG